MAVLSPSGNEQGYIKTVLSRENFMDLDSSSLALPSEEKLSLSRQDLEKAIRIQHQVRLTMARKSTKKSLANGELTVYGSWRSCPPVPGHVWCGRG